MRLLLACALVLACLHAQADETLWKLLEQGGQVLLLRHASTTPGVGDPQGFRLDDCKSQRNLSEAGRAQARRLGERLRERGVPVGRVVSSPWCRCIETAELAFGRVDERWTALGNLFGRSERAAVQVRDMRARIGSYRGTDNLVLVSHGSTASALAGVAPQQGEIVVLTPLGGREFRVAGRLSPPP